MASLDPNVVFTAAVAIVSSIVGGAMSLIGAAYHDERRAARERRSLATALIAEFNGAIQIEQEVGYRAEYQRCLDQIRAGHPEPMPNFHYEWDGGRSIYYTNLPRIGILPENVTNKLIRGASAFQVVVADRQCMDRGDWNTQSPEKRADMLARHLQMYDQVLVLCGEIITDLRKVK